METSSRLSPSKAGGREMTTERSETMNAEELRKEFEKETGNIIENMVSAQFQAIYGGWCERRVLSQEAKKSEKSVDWKTMYEQALSRIASQEATIAGMPRWVSVEEELPEKEGSYVVIERARRGTDSLAINELECDRWRWAAPNKVTHWLKGVPELPSSNGKVGA
jgi:VIT1/CCC1 family predicted Fe2+/Mn2+ transporter